MATTMHRLQISIPEWQAQYLAARARRDRVSIAEIIRQLVTSSKGDGSSPCPVDRTAGSGASIRASAASPPTDGS